MTACQCLNHVKHFLQRAHQDVPWVHRSCSPLVWVCPVWVCDSALDIRNPARKVRSRVACAQACSKCGEQKDAAHFHRDCNKPDGLRGRCRACEAAAGQARALPALASCCLAGRLTTLRRGFPRAGAAWQQSQCACLHGLCLTAG